MNSYKYKVICKNALIKELKRLYDQDFTIEELHLVWFAKALQDVGSNLIIQFFTLKRTLKGTTMMNGSSYCQNLCFYIPNEMRKGIIDYYYNTWINSECYKQNPTAMDYLVRDYLKDNKLKYWIYIPNLVQHIEGKSVIDPRRSSKRQSIYF